MFESALQQLQVQFYDKLRNTAWCILRCRALSNHGGVPLWLTASDRSLNHCRWSGRLDWNRWFIQQRLQGEAPCYWRNEAKELDFQTAWHLVESCGPREPHVYCFLEASLCTRVVLVFWSQFQESTFPCLPHVPDSHRLIQVKLWETPGLWIIMMLFFFLLYVMNLGLQARLQQGYPYSGSPRQKQFSRSTASAVVWCVSVLKQNVRNQMLQGNLMICLCQHVYGCLHILCRVVGWTQHTV